MRILNLKNSLVIYPVMFTFFVKSRLLFNIFHCFSIFVNNHSFHISRVRICQKVKSVTMQNMQYTIFYVKMNISADFRICISIPVRSLIRKKTKVLTGFQCKNSKNFPNYYWVTNISDNVHQKAHFFCRKFKNGIYF